MPDISISASRTVIETSVSVAPRLSALVQVTPGARPDLSIPVSVTRRAVNVAVVARSDPDAPFSTDLALLYQTTKV